VIGFNLVLTDPSGHEHKLTADSRDVLVWEKTSRTNETMADLIRAMSVVKYYRLAYIVARRLDIDVPADRGIFESEWRVDLASSEADDDTPTDGEVSTEM
jgi:hypothetical protein